MSGLEPDSEDGAAIDPPAIGESDPCVVFAWPDFEPQNLFAGLTASRLELACGMAARGIRIVMVWVGVPGAAGESRLRQWVAQQGSGKIVFETAPTACKMNFPWRLRWERAFDFHGCLRHLVTQHRVVAVNLPDTAGVGYYALLAKRGGLGYRGIRFVVEASGPLRKLRALDHLAIDNLSDLYQDFLERRCIEMADDLVVPDTHACDWLLAHDWHLPASVRAIEPAAGMPPKMTPSLPLARLVFVMPIRMNGQFPRICKALGQDAVRGRIDDAEVVFWGPVDDPGHKAISHITSCATAWPFRWRIEEDLSENALHGLFEDGKAAAILPCGRNVALQPYRWLMDSGVHCIELAAENAPSERRYIDAADARKVEGVMDADALEPALDALMRGARHANPASADAPERLRLRAELMLAPAADEPEAEPTLETPLVSVCIVTRNRAKLLPQALASIEAQDYPAVEVVLVDDGSTMKGALDLLDQLEPRFREKRWKLLRQGERTFHAAARNRAVLEASGGWVLLFDDDCVSEPHQIRTMVHFASRIGAAIVTSPRHVFKGDHAPKTGDRSGFVWVPLGAMPTAGLFENCLGDTNMLIRRDVFLKFDGLRTDFGVPSADREFLIRAAAAAVRLEVVPEVLYHYRMTSASVSRGLMPDTAALRDLRFARPFVELLPPVLGDLPHIAAGWMRRSRQLERELAKARAHIAQLEDGRKYRKGIRREFHIRLTADAMHRWLTKLWHSIQKRFPKDPPRT